MSSAIQNQWAKEKTTIQQLGNIENVFLNLFDWITL